MAETPLLPGRGLIEQVVALTVLLSVLLHGLSAAPLSTAYDHRVEKMSPDAPENEGAVVAPSRGGSVPTDGPKQAHEDR